MKCSAGLVWECKSPFLRYLEDTGISCEIVTPHMLAAPFYRGCHVTYIIPTGFGNPMYSCLLPALRASSGRIKKFINNGGRMLVFGAMSPKPGCYDWLPFPVTYTHEYFTSEAQVRKGPHCGILNDFDSSSIECDGFFPEYEGDAVITSKDDRTLMFCNQVGEGTMLLTSVHEYPSRSFIREFCSRESETLF